MKAKCNFKDLENENKKEGLIESLPSKLKEVYRRYVEIIDENERDIVDCGWSNYRMSEKALINLMERRIKVEKVFLYYFSGPHFVNVF